jgi:hypothetical protein
MLSGKMSECKSVPYSAHQAPKTVYDKSRTSPLICRTFVVQGSKMQMQCGKGGVGQMSSVCVSE